MIAMFKILYKQLLKLQCWVTGNIFGRLLVLYSSRNPQGLHTFALDLQPSELTQMSTTQYPSHFGFFQNPEPWLLLLAVLQVIPMDSWAIYVWVGCQQRGSEAKKRSESKPKSANRQEISSNNEVTINHLGDCSPTRTCSKFEFSHVSSQGETQKCPAAKYLFFAAYLCLPNRRSRENYGETCTFFCTRTRLIGQGQWHSKNRDRGPLLKRNH